MDVPDHRHLSLGDLTPDQLEAMRLEGETLFIEHKRGLGGDGFQLQKAMASLANTLGGWVILGDTNRSDEDIEGPGWSPPKRDLVDEVRPYLTRLHPVPAYAARVMTSSSGRRLGVIRVYESADTPHIVGGTVFVREPAEDKKLRLRGRFDIRPVGSSDRLAEMSRGGREAREAARQRLTPSELPVGNEILGSSSRRWPTSRGLRGWREVSNRGSSCVSHQ